MGRDMVSWTVHAMVSRHNSEQDASDDARWEEMKRRLEKIASEYEDLGVIY